MLSKKDQQEIKSLRAIRDAWRSAPIHCVTGKLCGMDYCFYSPDEIDAFLNYIGLLN